jgi:hypothetical protein
MDHTSGTDDQKNVALAMNNNNNNNSATGRPVSSEASSNICRAGLVVVPISCLAYSLSFLEGETIWKEKRISWGCRFGSIQEAPRAL